MRLGLWVTLALWLTACAIRADAQDNLADKPAESLYLQLGSVALDPDRVYQVRGASLDRQAISISLDDGTIAFTKDVLGHVTGAFFEGDGEILLTPPNKVERQSMSLFTGMAILEEHFATAYFRFNDDMYNELRPDLRATPENKQEFVDRWAGAAKNLANDDAMRLLMTFSRLLPVAGSQNASQQSASPQTTDAADRFLHARLRGTKLGVFDVYYDAAAPEAVQVGQPKTDEKGNTFYDVWASFSSNAAEPSSGKIKESQSEEATARQGRVEVRSYLINADVEPPKQIHARTRVKMQVREGGPRTLMFELSRFLQVESVKLDGQPVEFIHNPSVEGTQLSRRGNDLVAVVLPGPARAGQAIELEFVYGGEVLAEAGNGLLYVGERGTWYPNRGLAMADFDLTFNFPQGWTLVATGHSATTSSETDSRPGRQVSRWISDRPIPLAGFNLGKYKEATTIAGKVPVEVYATGGMEKNFPSPRVQVVEPNPYDPTRRTRQLMMPPRPSPARNELTVGENAAHAIEFYADRFGPYPYSHLALTQMPGADSQGWPGLVFLSSYAFLSQQDQQQLHFDSVRTLIHNLIPAHETAHQWWGDLITWTSYRDQWISEGLANYCALMMLQERDPAGFREIMNKYRADMIAKNNDGMSPMEAGPVTLGIRLWSSRFPAGYEEILYGRGTWLFHMLRTMLKDGAQENQQKSRSDNTDEPFVRGLRKIRERYSGKPISTAELLDVFAEDLPPSLRYEGKRSLDWFLDGWVNGTSLPKLELKGVKIVAKAERVSVTGTILQQNATQGLVTSVPVYGMVSGRQPVFLGRVFADGEESTFRLSAPAGTHKILLDPNEAVLTSPK